MSTPAGWYPDPQRAQTQRYWDGSAWSDHVAPAAVVESSNGAVIAAGYVFAVLMPIVGFIIGLTQINRREGLGVVVVSVVMGIVWWLMLSMYG